MMPTDTPSLVISFFAGVVLFFSPCIVPVLPAYLSAISGVSWATLRDQKSARWQVMSNAVAFVLGFSTLFTLMGTLLGLLGTVSGIRTWVNTIGGGLILILALHMLELINLPLLNREFNASGRVRTRGYVGSALMGGAFGLAWTPCTGPVLAAILTLSASAASVAQSALLMLAFSAGLAVPFLATGAFTGRITPWLSAHGVLLKWLHRATGIMLLVLGVLIFTGRLDGFLSGFLNFFNLRL